MQGRIHCNFQSLPCEEELFTQDSWPLCWKLRGLNWSAVISDVYLRLSTLSRSSLLSPNCSFSENPSPLTRAAPRLSSVPAPGLSSTFLSELEASAADTVQVQEIPKEPSQELQCQNEVPLQFTQSVAKHMNICSNLFFFNKSVTSIGFTAVSCSVC